MTKSTTTALFIAAVWLFGGEDLIACWFRHFCTLLAAAALSHAQVPPAETPSFSLSEPPGVDSPLDAEQLLSDFDDIPHAYPDEGQPVVDITDAEETLDGTFPQLDSVFRPVVPPSYFKWKENLYEQYGLKIGVSYNMLFQSASETASFANFDNALGHWWGLTTKWTLLNRGQDCEGSLVFSAHDRNAVGNNAVPAQYGATDVGMIWSNYEFTQWDFAIEDLYWEQWLKKDRFVFRAGNQGPAEVFNTFRFKDARTSFTASPFTFHESIPYGPFGLGFAFKWWPVRTESSEVYVTGVLSDINGNPTDKRFNWSTFGLGQYFYGIEIGRFWRRPNGEFDHFFVDLFYADERSFRSPDMLPNEAGGGVKFLGSKQCGRWVGFGSYTFNTAEGGSISVTFGRHTVTAGAAYLKPFGIQGEVAAGLVFMNPHPGIMPGDNLRDQYGLETYWKILLTPNMWITPGIQAVFNPSLNPTKDAIAIPHIKFRVAY